MIFSSIVRKNNLLQYSLLLYEFILFRLHCLSYFITNYLDFGAKNQNHRVSIVVATRNNNLTIEKSLLSILKQTYVDLEVIVIDDASTDDTAKTLAKLARDFPQLKILRNATQAGTGASRNRGLLAATGYYVTFQDGDDYSFPDRIAQQVRALQRSSRNEICLCSYVRVDENGRSLWVNGRRERKCIVSMMFVRERVLNKVGFFWCKSVGEDTDYYQRIKIAFGRRCEVRVWPVLYHALFREQSSFFNSVTLIERGARAVRYQRSDKDLVEYVELQERHRKMKLGLMSYYQSFSGES